MSMYTNLLYNIKLQRIITENFNHTCEIQVKFPNIKIISIYLLKKPYKYSKITTKYRKKYTNFHKNTQETYKFFTKYMKKHIKKLK